MFQVYLYIDGLDKAVAGVVVARPSVEGHMIDAACTETVRIKEPQEHKSSIPGIQPLEVPRAQGCHFRSGADLGALAVSSKARWV